MNTCGRVKSRYQDYCRRLGLTWYSATNYRAPHFADDILTPQCPELQNRRPTTMTYFLHVAMSHQWANIFSSWTSLNIFASLRQRDKLPQHNTIDDAVELIRKSQRILILTGAGISVFNRFRYSLPFLFLPPFLIGVSCGIPDFRSRDGLYASLKNQGDYDLDDPQQM
jgi:hypothetical protein